MVILFICVVVFGLLLLFICEVGRNTLHPFFLVTDTDPFIALISDINYIRGYNKYLYKELELGC